MDPIKGRSAERIERLAADPQECPDFFDLSATGVCCLHKKSLPTGTVVGVAVGDLKLKARVVHCTERTDGFRVGLQFVDLDQKQRGQLGEIVDKYSRGVPLCCAITGEVGDAKDD